MEESRWQRIEDLFQGALDRPAPQREVWLREQCAGDEELQAEVGRLLEHSGGAGEQLAAVVENARLALDGDAAPRQMGPYRLVRELGRGGMGSVWLAERADGGFAQTVAIKFVKRGMDTGEILQRFGQERQILSLLNHPNIAHLLDGGATPDGHPYLVMEYVDGQPVVEYCRAQAVPRVLALFQTICAAVQHAHSNLVIHRGSEAGQHFDHGSGRGQATRFRYCQGAGAGCRRPGDAYGDPDVYARLCEPGADGGPAVFDGDGRFCAGRGAARDGGRKDECRSGGHCGARHA